MRAYTVRATLWTETLRVRIVGPVWDDAQPRNQALWCRAPCHRSPCVPSAGRAFCWLLDGARTIAAGLQRMRQASLLRQLQKVLALETTMAYASAGNRGRAFQPVATILPRKKLEFDHGL